MSSNDEDLTMETNDTGRRRQTGGWSRRRGSAGKAIRSRRSRRALHGRRAHRARQGDTRRGVAASHGDWEPAAHRPDPVELLEEQAQSRVPELVPIRYGRMLVSPFTFYRGAAYLMASDLAAGPRTSLHTQLCGDAHLSNFGGYAAPDRKVVFSLNDFDETLPGPFEWDVKRLVASFAVAGRDRGFDAKQREAANLEVGRAYREGIARFSSMSNLALWYTRIDVDDLMAEIRRQATKDMKANVKRAEANVAKGRTKDSMKAFGKLTTMVDGEPRITGDPPLIVPIEDVAGDQVGSPARVPARRDPLLPAHARRRSPEAPRALPVRPRGPEGRRRRQCRHACLDLPSARPGRRRSAVPPVQGGAAVGARAVPRPQRVREQRSAGRRGPAPDAGSERHHAGLDQGRRPRRHQARLLRPAAVGRQDVGDGRVHGAARPRGLRPDLRHGARACARAGGRRRRDRRVPRRGRHVRPRDGPVRGVLRRPEREGLRGPEDRGRDRAGRERSSACRPG